MGGNNHIAVVPVGRPKGSNLINRQCRRSPLSLIAGENLQTIAADPVNSLKSQVQSTTDRFMRA
jgi:hypothetical protein